MGAAWRANAPMLHGGIRGRARAHAGRKEIPLMRAPLPNAIRGDYLLRSMCDEELNDLIVRLERQVQAMSQASTSLGAKLCAQYRAALQAARMEAERRRDE